MSSDWVKMSSDWKKMFLAWLKSFQPFTDKEKEAQRKYGI